MCGIMNLRKPESARRSVNNNRTLIIDFCIVRLPEVCSKRRNRDPWPLAVVELPEETLDLSTVIHLANLTWGEGAGREVDRIH